MKTARIAYGMTARILSVEGYTMHPESLMENHIRECRAVDILLSAAFNDWPLELERSKRILLALGHGMRK